jgi:hypothetical protein
LAEWLYLLVCWGKANLIVPCHTPAKRVLFHPGTAVRFYCLFRTYACDWPGRSLPMLSLILHELSLRAVVLESGLVSHAAGSVRAVQVGRVGSGWRMAQSLPPRYGSFFHVRKGCQKKRCHHPFRRGGGESLNSAQCRLGTVL